MSIYFLTNPEAGTRWTDAEAQAVAAGGHLVTIDDEDEQTRLNKAFTDRVSYQGSSVRESYWIGLRDPVGDNRSDAWVSGATSTYRHWASGEPSSASEQYVELNPLFATGFWNDRINEASPIGGRGIVEIPTPGSTIYGTEKNELIVGNSLNNNINALAGNDTVDGGLGNDKIYGSSGSDSLSGAVGNDTIDGGVGIDRVYGDSGNDLLYGGLGNDLLVGGLGSDTLIGGGGADSFALNGLNEPTDTIVDFSVVDDTIRIYGFGGDLTPGRVISANQFHIGSSAADSSDRFIYNNRTGLLFFDQDGLGGAAQTQIARLSAGLAMTNRDIYIATLLA